MIEKQKEKHERFFQVQSSVSLKTAEFWNSFLFADKI
jgi:hypothetical protein